MVLSRLAQELKKRQPFERPEEEVYLNLIRSAEWLGHDSDRLLKQYGLSEATYNVLRILRGAGGDGLPCQEIGVRMVTRVPDITRLLDRLEGRNLVQRNRTQRDRRVVLVSITPQGLELLASLDQPVNEQSIRQFAHMTREELGELNRLLEKARESVGEPAEHGPTEPNE